MRIRKITAVVLALLLMITAFSLSTASATEPVIYDIKRGDFDGDGKITADDAVYLLYNGMYGEVRYPINHNGDFNENGTVDHADAIHLLYSYMFGQDEYALPEVEGHLFLLPNQYYQYNSLTDTEKEAYNRIKEAVYSYTNRIELGDLGIELNRAVVVYKRFIGDNPQCFWIAQRFGVSYSEIDGEDIIGSITLFYTDGEVSDETGTADRSKINAQRAEVDTEIARVVAQIDPDWSDVKKELFIHDYLVDGMQYDQEAASNNYVDADNKVIKPAFNIYGAFINKLGVCEAYTEAFQTLCYAVGIQCNQITGNNHVWNTVLIDGVWYMIDVTWDDPITSDGSPYKQYVFFNLTEEQMSSTNNHSEVINTNNWVYPQCTTEFDQSVLWQ